MTLTTRPTSPVEDVETLLFAVPKKGRLFERVNNLLLGAGLDYTRPQRVDIALCNSLPVKLVFLPAADIAKYVADGKVDMGITGEDIIAENASNVQVLEKLGFGKCKLGVQAPVGQFASAKDLAGKRIVTSFPHLSREYFKQFETENTGLTSITYVSGSVEAACGLGLADGIVDLVETGTTMKAAGLELIDRIMETQAVLISNLHSTHEKLINKIHLRIQGCLVARKYCVVTYNIARSRLTDAKKITPGKKAPTITLLDDSDDYVAVSAMTQRSEIANVMDQLMELGATDILMMNIENCRC